ncbi:LAME_0H01332g1_1 [Lachancea meyersii CBS 8951]|uniref:LAME_0H01332g1_1 n=1 Tax=Lachancea meyersii CBS 8951 TaxID=1266667 RepID=A0A1G4KDC7_9SACH|nr:LAME_0H01332g1_1 [Lachancea meyersii CBS 8951]
MLSITQQESGLTEMQQQVSEIVQHGVIDPNFKFTDSDFEILSTLRYDPGFTNSRTSASRHARPATGWNETGSVDPQLTAVDLHESLRENGEMSHDENSLFQLIKETQRDVQPISPPTELDNEETTESSESELLKTFYNRFLLLGEQFKRLTLALDYFGWDLEISIDLLLEKLILALPCPIEAATNLHTRMQSLYTDETCYKMRVLVSHTGKMRIEAHELPSNPNRFSTPSQYFLNTILGGLLDKSNDAVWDVFIDTQAMTASPFTTFKTTRRDHYNAARSRMEEMRSTIVNSGARSEILVYNNAFELMEGSITSVAVLQEKPEAVSFFYQTPYLSTGCLCGVMRYYLVSKNLINEGQIDVRDLRVGDTVLLFNGVMGCVKGVIRNSLE